MRTHGHAKSPRTDPDPPLRPSVGAIRRPGPWGSASAVALAAAAGVSAGAFAQGYLPPENAARRSMDTDNPFCGGQPADLIFEIESVEFHGDPCPDMTVPTILKKATMVVEVGWIKSQSYFGVMAIQAEGDNTTDGADSLVVQINGRGRWTIESVTRDGVDCLGGPSAEGMQGGNGTWDGVKLTPPEVFEEGRYDDGSDPDAASTMRYTFTLKYLPLPGDQCKVVGFIVNGYYLHTYDGTFEWSCDNALQVSGSFPWGVSFGGAVSWANDHAWNRPLVNATGGDPNHNKECEPGPGWVPSQECCPQPVATPGGGAKVNGSTTVPTPDPFGFKQEIDVSSDEVDSDDVTDIELVVRDPQELEVARIHHHLPSPCPGICGVVLPFTLPGNYPYEWATVDVTAWGQTGHLGFRRNQFAVALPGPRVPTVLAASGLPEGRLLGNDVLLVFPHDPTVPSNVAAQHVSVRSIDGHGAVRDLEQGFAQFPDGHVQFPIVESPLSVPGNHLLEVGTDDVVVVDYWASGTNQHLSVFVPVDPNTEPNAILPCAAAQPSYAATALVGASWPMATTIAARLRLGTGVSVAETLLGAATPDTAAVSQLKGALLASGMSLAPTTGAAIAVAAGDPHDGVTVPERGQGLRWVGASLPLPGDLNGDGTVNGADLAVLLGAWGTPAGDLTGDGATDGADLAMLLGAWS